MTLDQEIQTVNDIRLGMFTRDMSMTEVNKNLDEMLPSLSESELNAFMQNLSLAYGKVKIWAEANRKKKIQIEVGENEQKKLALAEKKRKAKEKRNAKDLAKLNAKVEDIIKNPGKVNGIVYDSDPATNKAIKEFVRTGLTPENAVAMLKSIGALPESYELR